MAKPMKRMLIIVGILLLLIFGWYGIKKLMFLQYMKNYTPPAVTITASKVAFKTWQSFISTVGTLSAEKGVNISTEVAGVVKEIRFVSGQNVHIGDILVLLDTSIEQAELKDRQAALKLAQLNYERDESLAKKNALSPAALDVSFAKLQQAEASAEEIKARIKLKTITAPFDGQLGIRLINIGEYLSPGTPIVTLQSMDPLLVRFNVPEKYASSLFMNQRVNVTIQSKALISIPGVLSGINAKVDQGTRNILAEATIPNKTDKLYPGMYAEVKIWLASKKNVITVPQTAITFSLHGDAVFIIKNEGQEEKTKTPILKAYRQYVVTGDRRQDEVEILKGLKSNDEIVTSGQLKLQNGTRILIDANAGL